MGYQFVLTGGEMPQAGSSIIVFLWWCHCGVLYTSNKTSQICLVLYTCYKTL